jgi:hypothetical protein
MLAEDPPLLSLRVGQGLRVDDVVAALVDRLELEPGKSAKVKRYYQRLEGGLLDPRRLSKRLRVVLADILGASAEAAVAWTAPQATAGATFLRRADYVKQPASEAPAAAEPGDEIDQLFMGGE